MRRLSLGLAILALAGLAARTDESSAKNSEGYEALLKEFNEARGKFAKDVRDLQKEIADAKTDADKAVAEKKLAELQKDHPTVKFAERFLDFAQNNPKDAKASQAALTAYRLSSDPQFKDAARTTRRLVIKYFKDTFADKPEIKQVLVSLLAAKDPAGESLYREVLAKNPDLRLQSRACKALAAVATDDDEKEKLNKQLAGKYAEFFPDLNVDKPIPNVVSQDLDGKEVKMSDYKGNVVVIDIWATWCGPCRAMIPHEKEMVERLKDKKFKLVSVSIDAEKKTLADFVEKEKMGWTPWWAGLNTGWIDDWNVQFIPTIYVVDAKGTIRYKDLRGDKLEEAVNELLKETEEKKDK